MRRSKLYKKQVETAGFDLQKRYGVAEAIESADGGMYAVQWHPEELVPRYERFRPLFHQLIEQACARKH